MTLWFGKWATEVAKVRKGTVVEKVVWKGSIVPVRCLKQTELCKNLDNI
jgi:hypothetical protein